MLAEWAYQLGGDIVVLDNGEERLEPLRRIGIVTAPLDGQSWRLVKTRWHGQREEIGADVVFQCRADQRAVQVAIKCVKPGGTIVDLAFYQSPIELSLGEDFHHFSVGWRSAHISIRPPRARDRWNSRALMKAGLAFLLEDSARLKDALQPQLHSFDAAPEMLGKLAESGALARAAVLCREDVLIG